MTVRMQVILPFQSGLPRDVATNTFYFDHPTGTPLTCAQTAYGRLVALYNTINAPGTSPISTYLSGVIVRNQCRIVGYDLEEPTPRAPIFEDGFVLGAASGDNAPNEIALVGSFQGERVAGVPQSRRRGRTYFGPLKLAAISAGSATSSPTPSTNAINAVVGGMDVLATASNAECIWVTRSQTYGTVAEVSNGWVDNDLDTQRRRQPRASARTVWATP